MCCCGTPTINGQPGYRWQPGDTPTIRHAWPPTIPEGYTVLFDEPGRCGGQDSHSFHYTVAGPGLSRSRLYVKHGGGQEEIPLSHPAAVVAALGQLDSTGRYWLLNALYHAQSDARRAGREEMAAHWRTAAAEGRVKVRKVRNSNPEGN